jgi:hypothetical protein
MAAKVPLEVAEKVLEDLINARNMDDIVTEVCEKTGLEWKRAESFVTRLFVENKNRIALSQKILEDLTSARNMDDIVREVCEKADLDWKRAESLVNRLSAENSDKIILSQSPVLVPLALFTFVSGVVLVFYDLYQFYQVYSANSKTFLFEMLFLGMNGQVIFWSFLFGVAMVIGSLKGMERIWGAVFERFGKVFKLE